MKISVIIPCYTIEKHLPKCIESVLVQTFTDFELLLVNDGSTDSTLEICESYQAKDSRIRVFSHTNSGVSYTRNQGIANASGDFILFIDGDDWIETTLLASLYAVAQLHTTLPICGITHELNGFVFKNKAYQKLIAIYGLHYDSSQFLDLFFGSALSSPCCKLYSAQIIKERELRFDEAISYQEDVLFNLKYLKYVTSISLLDSYPYHYVEHSNSSSGRFHKNLELALSKILEYLKKFSSSADDQSKIEQYAFNQILKSLSNVVHKNSNYTFATQYSVIKKLLNSSEYHFSEKALSKNSINFLLKRLIKEKNIFLLLCYYQLNKFLK